MLNQVNLKGKGITTVTSTSWVKTDLKLSKDRQMNPSLLPIWSSLIEPLRIALRVIWYPFRRRIKVSTRLLDISAQGHSVMLDFKMSDCLTELWKTMRICKTELGLSTRVLLMTMDSLSSSSERGTASLIREATRQLIYRFIARADSIPEQITQAISQRNQHKTLQSSLSKSLMTEQSIRRLTCLNKCLLSSTELQWTTKQSKRFKLLNE